VPLSVFEIAALIEEVNAETAGGLVQRLWDGRPGELAIRLRCPGENKLLLVAVGNLYARLHLASGRPTRRERPTAFVSLLRKELTGSRLISIEQISGDRLARLEFNRPWLGDEGDAGRTLIAELTGRHGNLLLLDSGGVILGSIRPNVSHRRQLISGEAWIPPAASAQTGGAGASSPEATVSSESVERRIEREIEAESSRALRTRVVRAIRKALKRAKRKSSRIERDLEASNQAEELQRYGELLRGAHGKTPRGSEFAIVTDYRDPDMAEVSVPLDPRFDLNGNIERYFKRAKRLKAGRKIIRSRLEQVRTQERRLAQAADELNDGDPAEILTRLVSQKLVKQQVEAGRAVSGRAVERLPYHLFRSRSGQPIMVGKGAKDNDHLSMRIARGNDLWLHVDGASGAHVVVRLPKKTPVDSETLLDAATLAAHYSKRKNDTVVEVRYCRKADLRKPKGVAPGAVNVLRSKTVSVRLEQQRLDRLMASRQQD